MRLSIAKRHNIKRIYTHMQVHKHTFTRVGKERRGEIKIDSRGSLSKRG